MGRWDMPRFLTGRLLWLIGAALAVAALPMTGSPDGEGNNAGALARINSLREEPAPSRRFFVNDLTGRAR